MRKTIFLICATFMFSGLLGYKHLIKLDSAIKNTPGTYNIILDNMPKTTFQLIIEPDQKVRIGKNPRGVDVSFTPKGHLLVESTVTDEVCLHSLTIIDTEKDLTKKLGSNTIKTKAFRTSASGPSFCGDYKFRLTIKKTKNGNRTLKFDDKTDINYAP